MKKRSKNGGAELLLICSLLGIVGILIAICLYAMGHTAFATVTLIAGLFLSSGFLLPYLVIFLIYIVYWGCIFCRGIGTGNWSLK